MSFTPITSYVLDQVLGFEDMNEIRGNIVALATMRHVFPLGGSRQTAIAAGPSSCTQNALDYLDVEIDGTNLSGLTAKLRVEVRAASSSVSITPQLWNVTSSSAAATGSACLATAADYSGLVQIQSVAATIASGVNKYRLRETPSSSAAGGYMIGYLELYATSSQTGT